jgi:hypothetical protein
MQDLLKKYCQHNQGLLLLSMPTGFGKTYNVFKFIYDNYKEFAAKNRKIIFLTNLKKNLVFEDLEKLFIADSNEDDYDKYVLFIDSNSESVIKNLIKLEDEIPPEFKDKESYKILNKRIEICQNEKLPIPKEVQDSFKHQIRKELEPAFRGDIQKILKERFPSKEARLKAIKDKQDYQWIGKLYPAVFTDEKTVLFMSMDKFILRNSTLIEPSYFFYERLDKIPFKDALIFIDEFDSTKDRILNNIIESGLQRKVDFIDLFLNIHNHLKQLKDSEDLTKCSKHWKQKQKQKTAEGKDWLSPKQQIEDLKKKAQEIFNKYQLQHTCKSDQEFFTKKRNFLFYDYKFHNVIDVKKRIEIHQDSRKRTNWIKYDKVTIKPKFIGKEADNKDKAIKQLEELLNDEHTANRLWYDLEHKIKGEQKYIEFLFCRYVRALTAWKYFIDNPDCHSFLCFFNKSPKHNDPEFDLKILYEYAELLLYDNKDAIADSISKTIVVLTGDNFDDLKKEISNDLKENKRRFIISTYKTIGVGQNLQFGIPSSIKPIHINSFTESKYMDINGIYLDKPTNLLININNENIKDDDFIEYIFQLEFLRENGAFSQNIFKSKLDEAFRRYVGMDKYQKKADDFISLYNTDAYSLFLNKVIIQAIGRICRTNMKAPTIHILADDNIRKHLTKFSLPEDVIPVHEYTALLKLAGEPINKSQDLIKSQNIASLRSDQTYNYIYSQINTPWRSESVKEWQDLREQVLCQPAIAKESDCNLKWNIYVKLPKPTNSYYFSQENDYREIEIFFSDEYGKKQVQKVSEQTSRLSELMRINILRKLFINEGYATEFPESELMLTPPMFNNIYKGALGEVCGKHILETILKIPLLELEINEFERFDFKIDQNIYIDFKLWNDKIAVEADQEIEKIRNKMDEVGAEKVFIINILGSSDSPFRERISSDSKIVQVPYLCKNDQIDNEAITFIMKEFKK